MDLSNSLGRLGYSFENHEGIIVMIRTAVLDFDETGKVGKDRILFPLQDVMYAFFSVNDYSYKDSIDGKWDPFYERFVIDAKKRKWAFYSVGEEKLVTASNLETMLNLITDFNVRERAFNWIKHVYASIYKVFPKSDELKQSNFALDYIVSMEDFIVSLRSTKPELTEEELIEHLERLNILERKGEAISEASLNNYIRAGNAGYIVLKRHNMYDNKITIFLTSKCIDLLKVKGLV